MTVLPGPVDVDALCAAVDAVPEERALRTVVYVPGPVPSGEASALIERLAALPGDPPTFVLVAPFAAAVGAPDGAAAAATAAVLESAAHRLRGAGRDAVYVAWHDRGDLPGARAVPVQAAMAAIRHAVGAGAAATAVVDADWTAWDRASAPAVLRDLVGDAPAPRTRAATRIPLAERLAEMSAADQEDLLLDVFRDRTALILGYGSPDEIEVGDTFLDIGFSSFTALELSNELTSQTGVALSPAVIMDHPTPLALVRHVRTVLAGDAG